MIKDLSFSNPSAMWLIPLLLLLLGLALVEMRRRQAFLKAFGELPLVSQFSGLGPEWPRRLRPLFLSLALIGVAAALARPVSATKSGENDRRLPDIVLLLDVSRSMGAEDYAPKISRLGKAKAMIFEALPGLAGTRVGIVTFAGAAFQQAPLTADHTALKFILTNWVFLESAPPGGSDIAQGIRSAVRFFESRQGERVVLLFSDGGHDHPEDLRLAVGEARSKGIRIFAFGLGGPVASKIPQYDSNAGFSGWLTLNGEVVTTRLDEGMMKEIAAGTKGAYSRVISGRELQETLTRLKIRAHSPAEARNLFQWPLGAALVLLFVERVSAGLTGWRFSSAFRRKTAVAASH
ncbi:MAG: VWA domain-containing protein [Candidatus Rokubacteria bacterium]|nr:VWA domain-containing protein [Candidatus Rokubacteria bacterium]